MVARRKQMGDISHVFQQYLYYRGQATTADRSKEKHASKLRDFCRTYGVVQKDDDGNFTNGGNIEYALPEKVYVGDKVYVGFELRRQGGQVFDEDRARELAKEKDIEDDVLTRTLTLTEGEYRELRAILQGHDLPAVLDVEHEQEVDQDAFYVAYQRGKITEEEIDSLLVEPENPRYALWPVEGSDDE